MGGPGFVGIKVRRSDGSARWIVVAVWSASEWLTINGAPCRDGYFEEEREVMEKELGITMPTLMELNGSTIDAIVIETRELTIDLSGRGVGLRLGLRADSSDLPIFRGSKEPRVMQDDEDIRDAIIVSRRANLWL